MALNLSPQLEAKLTEAAHQHGQDLDTLLEQLLDEKYPALNGKVPVELSEKKKAAIAWLDERLAEAPTDPEGIREAQAELDELMQNLNGNRIESGKSPLLP